MLCALLSLMAGTFSETLMLLRDAILYFISKLYKKIDNDN